MTDSEKKRPNANYNLSRPQESASQGASAQDTQLNFYYNRERRLENAPPEVKNMYSDDKPNRFGLFGSLVADRPRKILFLMIIFLCILIFALSMLGFLDESYTLDGNKLEIKGTRFEDNTIMVIRKTVKNKDAYTGRVEITVSPRITNINDEYPEYKHSIDLTFNDDEVYKFAVPFNEEELMMVLQTDKGNLQLRIKPD